MKSGILAAALLAFLCGAAPGAWAQVKLPGTGKLVATKPIASSAILGDSANRRDHGDSDDRSERGDRGNRGGGDDRFGHFGGEQGSGGGSSRAR